jgi:hypothetical protein
MQQLSLAVPQSVSPGPPGPQLGGTGPASGGVTAPLEEPPSTAVPPPELELEELELVDPELDVVGPLDEPVATVMMSAPPSTMPASGTPHGTESSLRPHCASASMPSIAGIGALQFMRAMSTSALVCPYRLWPREANRDQKTTPVVEVDVVFP